MCGAASACSLCHSDVRRLMSSSHKCASSRGGICDVDVSRVTMFRKRLRFANQSQKMIFVGEIGDGRIGNL